MKKEKIIEGKSKIIYDCEQEGALIQYFKDDVTAFNSKKSTTLIGKGALNNRISEYLMLCLEEIRLPTHLIRRLNLHEQMIHQLDIVPIEVVVRNIAAGSLCKRLGLEKGLRLPRSIVEFFLKDDKLDDPMITEEHITALGWAAPQEIDDMTAIALRANDFLQGLFLSCNLILVDMKLEFGRHYGEDGEVRLLIADEISPDSMRLWDKESKEPLDKDIFREDKGDLTAAYGEVAKRLGIINDNKL